MKNIVKYLFQYILIFCVGGCGYYYIEVLLRGWSHYSMFYLGGLCFCFFSLQKKVSWWRQEVWHQIARCLIFLLSGEFITGCMVNLWKGWQVWDYSEVPLNLLGQICLPMTLAFAILCYLALIIDDWIQINAFGVDLEGFTGYTGVNKDVVRKKAN